MLLIRFVIILFLHFSLYANVKTHYIEHTTSLSQKLHQFKMEKLLQRDFIPLDSNYYKDYVSQSININDNLLLK